MNLLEALIQGKIAGGGSGGSGTDSNAVHYTADSNKTDSEKAQARTNIAAQTKRFEINVTVSNGVVTADKTTAEIKAAIQSGADCVVVYGFYTCRMAQYNNAVPANNVFEFTCTVPDTTNHEIIVYTFILEAYNDSWTFAEDYYEAKPHLVVDTSSSTYSIDALNQGYPCTIYKLGTLTSLSIDYVYNNDYIVKFTSGSTPTTCTFPAGMKFPTADNQFAGCDANTSYEISVSNGYALVASWPVVSS